METIDEIVEEVKEKTEEKVRRPMNRAQRRAAARRAGRKGRAQVDAISETATKLNYIDLIQKFRALNEKKEKDKEIEDNEETN